MEGGSDNTVHIKEMDDLIRHLGKPCRFQVMVFVLVCLTYFPVVFHHVCMAFYGYTPPFECHPQPAFPSDNLPKPSGSEMTSYKVNETAAESDNVKLGSCDFVKTSEAGVNRQDQCAPGEFRYLIPDGEKTAVTEWDLVCERAYLTHLATTVYYCGVMLGGFACGYLSDYFGRRPVLLVTLAGVTIVGTGLAFVQNFATFVALRFVLGFLTQGLQIASYVIALELWPVEERTLAGCVVQLFWGGAVLALGGVAWLLKDWRHIQLAISLPSVLAVSYFWLVPESLRWLLAKDQGRKAEGLIQRIAAFNRLQSPLRSQPQLATSSLLQQHSQLSDSHYNSRTSVHCGADSQEKKEAEKTKKLRQGSLKDLFSTTVMLKRSLVLFFIWFAGNLAYFGLTFMSTSLAGNRFLNYSLSGGVEFMAYVINLFVVQRFGRRNPLCFYLCVAAISCLCVGFIPPVTGSGVDLKFVVIGFSVLGKFAAGGTFTVLDLLTVEMYPTVLRNVGAGLCAFWGRLGAVVAPQCLNLGLYTFSQLPAILIGTLALLGSLMTRLLPDTSSLQLPDTVYQITVDSKGPDIGSAATAADSQSLLPHAERVTSV